MKLIYPFDNQNDPSLEQVGGKAMSLSTMTRQGLPVPGGFVLTVSFFQPWLDAVRATPEWNAVLKSPPDELKQNCAALKALCTDFKLDYTQHKALSDALAAIEDSPTFAVRSSSPEEDLEELSFAGGYETVLGVTRRDLTQAIQRSFASCLDERVFLYKKENGLPVDQPRIAVIIQKQLLADTAGVAFSLNPINNCYDEAVINANFGLGESVVAGMASPDAFIVDKVSRSILEKKQGDKETSVWLTPDGGTQISPPTTKLSTGKPSGFCVSDAEVLQITDMLIKVENFYQRPIDIEWAFENGSLSLLQARPITAFFPLPEEVLTAPGESKLLYADLTLIKWGMHAPLTVMGTDLLKFINILMIRFLLGDISVEGVEALRRTYGGRTYLVISNMIRMQGKEKYANEFRIMDPTGAEIILNIEDDEYVPESLPPALKGIAFKAIRQNLGLGLDLLNAFLNPARQKEKYLKEEGKLLKALRTPLDQNLPVQEYAEHRLSQMFAYVETFYPTFFLVEIARRRLNKLFAGEEQEIQDKLAYLERSLPNNVTVDMGLNMVHLASYPEIKETASGAQFVAQLEAGAFSSEFTQAWKSFMQTYGFRSPMEMDVGAPRFYEHPEKFFNQLKALAETNGSDHKAQAIFEQAVVQREQAYEELLQIAQAKGKRKARQFVKDARILVDLGGYRESPKYYLVLITDMIRKRILEAAQPLVESGRLDSPDQVFDLTFDDLERGLDDPSIDLYTRREGNIRYYRKLRHVRELPAFIDSRGKILAPPKKEAGEGELVGEPISPGIVRGKVKVLHQPDEKVVQRGDILVTRTTDPGWTPLFINAAGVILEIGGMLQHGALVAREYGKPCVSGVKNATEILVDGQMVEIDGLNGVVRLLAT